jgi:integrase
LSLDIGDLPGGFSLTLAADFSLDEEEIQKGQAAVAGFLETLEGDEHNTAREALETLTLVFSTGVCEGVDFPWHQIRAHHGRAAITMLKEEGAPSRLEALRCELDPHRKFHQDPERYTPKKIQRFRTALKRVLKESRDLGFMSDDDWNRVKSPNKDLPQAGERIVSHGEFRALLAACQFGNSVESPRDRLIFYLLYHGGLMLAELMAVAIDDLHFDQKTQHVTVRTGKAKNQKSRRVALPNEALISLEDWLQFRGNDEGALLNPTTKTHRVELRRMTGPEVKAACEKRAREVGVAIFTPDELRKSPAAQIGQAKTAGKKTDQGKTETELASSAKAGDALYDPSGVIGQRKMAKVCFPVWELGIKS